MKVYIAGAITGHPDYKEKFKRAAIRIKKDGHVVLNPATLPGGMTPGEYMKICFAMIDVADAVFFLPDWMESAGAMLEHTYCQYISKEVKYM